MIKNPPANAGDTRNTGSIPGSGRSSRVGNGNSLQYSYPENAVDRIVWHAVFHRFAKSCTRMKQLSIPAHKSKVRKNFYFPCLDVSGSYLR